MMRRQRERRRGAAAVEMAVVFPVFMLLVLGIIEFGRFMMVGQLLTNVSREGARMAIAGNSTEAEIQTYMESFLETSTGIASERYTIAISTESGALIQDAATRDLINVNITVPFTDVSLLAFLDDSPGGTDYFWGLRSQHLNNSKMSAMSAMRKE